MKKARPKSVKTNYSENANTVTETNKQNPRTLGAEGWMPRSKMELLRVMKMFHMLTVV